MRGKHIFSFKIKYRHVLKTVQIVEIVTSSLNNTVNFNTVVYN